MRLATRTYRSFHLSTDGERLVCEHLSLVPEILRQIGRRLPAHVDRNDLAGSGTVALVEAALHFNPERGLEFPAFAAKRVRGAMLDELRRWDWAARSVRSEGRRREDVLERLRMKLGREPSAKERANAQGMSLDRLRSSELESVCATVISLHDLVEREGNDRLPAADVTPDEVLLEHEEKGYLRDAVNALPERERHAVAGYYLHDRPMRELAVELGVSASRVSQLCKQGLTLLHEALASYRWDRHSEGHPAGVATRGRHRHRVAVGSRSACKTRRDSARDEEWHGGAGREPWQMAG